MTADAPDSVGDILGKELRARGWTQTDFAEIIGRPPQLVSEVMNGKKELTRETATQFAAAFGTPSAEFWLRTQDSYRLWLLNLKRSHQEHLDAIRVRAAAVTRRRELAGAVLLVEEMREIAASYRVLSGDGHDGADGLAEVWDTAADMVKQRWASTEDK